MTQHPNTIERLYSLDVLRGLAALGVVLWHWQNFFFQGTHPVPYPAWRLPLAEWGLFVFYSKGWLAVDLFFSISGFIFFLLYARRIAEGTTSPGRFVLLRFSRLYPLHFATLLIVAIAQLWLLNVEGSYFVYPNNDSTHFLLNLLFASSWGMERGYSLNGPSWSVSVEVFLYALFFLCCRLFPIRAIVLALISATGFFVVQAYYSPIGRGIGSFFLGGCACLAYQAVLTSRSTTTLTTWARTLMIGAWVATIVIVLFPDEVNLSVLSLRSVPLLWRFDASLQWSIQTVLSVWPSMILFPLTILSLALLETQKGPLGKHVAFLGDISYSVLLLQFPLQLLLSVVVARFAASYSTYSYSAYYTPWFMCLFFAVLLVASLVTFRYFEVPAQRFLRRYCPA